MTVFGYDVSNFQGNFNHAAAKAEGMAFVAAKCTEGRSYADPAWKANLAGARAAGLYVAAYHFLRSDSPAADQAANLAANIGDPSVPVMVDCEPSGTSKPTMAHVTGFQAACAALGLKVTLLYLPGWYWPQIGSPALTGHGVALWQSAYGTNPTGKPATAYPGDTAPAWAAFGGLTPTILQFSSRATVAGQPIDVDAYRGNPGDLSQWFKGDDMSAEDVQKINDNTTAQVDRVLSALSDFRTNQRSRDADTAARDQQVLDALTRIEAAGTGTAQKAQIAKLRNFIERKTSTP